MEYISFVNGNPVLKVEGDKKEYPLSHVLGVGKIPNPYEDKTEEEEGSDPEIDPDTGENGEETTV